MEETERGIEMFACMECGKKFRTANAAYKASINGCPKCGGVDIDLDVANDETTRNQRNNHHPAPTRKENEDARSS
jgi:hypothetical protein